MVLMIVVVVVVVNSPDLRTMVSPHTKLKNRAQDLPKVAIQAGMLNDVWMLSCAFV